MLNTRSHAYSVFSTHREYYTNVSTHSTTYSIPILSVSCVLAAKKRVTRAPLAGTHLSAADFSYEYNHVIQTITVNVIMRNGEKLHNHHEFDLCYKPLQKTINQVIVIYLHTDSMSMHLKLLIFLF